MNINQYPLCPTGPEHNQDITTGILLSSGRPFSPPLAVLYHLIILISAFSYHKYDLVT